MGAMKTLDFDWVAFVCKVCGVNVRKPKALHRGGKVCQSCRDEERNDA